jgi:hypothetical protein
MKSILFLSTILFTGVLAFGQPSHPNSPHDTLSGKNIRVTYGRPYKKGRVIFGGLQKYGQVWRCGADEATEITFSKDGTLGGKPVKAGTYTFWVTPNEKSWTITLNSDTKFWGTEHESHKAKDILSVEVPTKSLDKAVEQLTIKLPGKDMIIEWDKTQVSIPVNFG